MIEQRDNKMKISVIIPMYNSEKYLEECISSVIMQTLKDIEIICVDAGSTDKTVDIILNYQKRDSRIKLIHSTQKSYGYQVQMGIENASGDYIGIVESDDYLETWGMEAMYQLAVKNDLDILKTNFSTFVDVDGIRYFIPEPLVSEDYYEKVYCFPRSNAYFFTRGEYVWNGIYKRELFIKNNIQIHHSPKAAFQDKGIYVKTMYYATRVMWTDECSAYRYRRDNGQSSTFDENAIDYVINEYRFIFDFLRDKKDALEIRTILLWKLLGYLNQTDFVIFRPYFADAISKNYASARELLLQVRGDGVKEFDVSYIQQAGWDLFINHGEAALDLIKRNSDICMKFYKSWVDKIKEKENIVIFGAGKMGKHLIVFLKTNDIKIKCICDNNEDLYGKKIGDVIICGLNDVIQEKNNYYIISSQNFSFDIEQQLLLAGVSQDKIERFRTPLSTAMCVCKV